MVAEGCQIEGVGAAIGWQGFCMAVEGDGLVGPCASGVHKVGKEADVVGGGLQRCVAEVDCVVWRRAIPYSGGRFGTRTPFCGSWRPHVRLAIFGEATWLPGAKVYTLDLSENG
jgi:hypothetical protein